MASIQIAPGITFVGVLNPSLRVFDIIMRAQYGTSYNAYLVQGERGAALIDASHEGFTDEFLANVESVLPLPKIDYLVVNHTEPDHTGCIAELLRRHPDITVVGTNSAHKYLAAMVNTPYKQMIVKEGNSVDLGGRVLAFHPAPLLHWPDSMFTFDAVTRTAFTCDFLGEHFCEPRLFDERIQYRDAWDRQFKYYFDCIFGPFKPYVLKGLDILAGLEPERVCPSHGTVKIGSLARCVNLYREWSIPAPTHDKKLVAIPYASAYGYTARLAFAARDALEAAGFETRCADIVTTPLEEVSAAVAACDALLVGTDTINRDATKPVWDVLTSIDAVNTKGRPAGAFGSYGWSGEAVPMALARLAQLGFKAEPDGVKVNFRPTDDDLAKVAQYALAVAEKIK